MKKFPESITVLAVFVLVSGPRPLKADFELLRDSDPVVRSAEARRLGSERVKEAVPALLEALNDEMSGVKINAIAALGELGDEAAIDPLIHILNNDEIPAARAIAAEALGRFKSEKVNDYLLRATESEDENVRISAVRTLGETGADGNIDRLIRIAESDTAWPVRESAVTALGSLAAKESAGRSRVTRVLNNIRRRDDSERVKNSVGDALENLKRAEPEKQKRRFLLF